MSSRILDKQTVRGLRGVLAPRARHVIRRAACAAVVMIAVPAISRSQQSATPKSTETSSSGDSLAVLLAAITTDTGAFAPGHVSFTRYNTPTFCLVAARHAIDVSRRSLAAQEELDRLRRDPVHDTLPAAVAPVARGCAAQFTVAGTAVKELPNLFELALLAQADSVAAAVLARRLAMADGPGVRAALLLDAMQRYLAAEPARLPAAEALMARLDAMGQGVAVLPARIQAHERLRQLGDSTSDETRVRHEAEQIITLTRALQKDSLSKYAENMVTAYQALIALAYFHAPDSMRVLARQLQEDARRGQVPGHRYGNMPLDSIVSDLAPVGRLDRFGAPTPPLRTDFWFPAKDTVQPMKGHVSLFVEVPRECYDSYESSSVLDPIAAGCTKIYDMIRQWQARYGGAGLDMTLVAWTSTKGGTVLSGPQTPPEAANNLQWYFLQYLHLPVGHLAVQVIPLTAPLPAPDGRIFFSEPNGGPNKAMLRTPFDLAYHADNHRQFGDPALVLTGRDGIELYAGGPSTAFDKTLARVIAAPATAIPAASTPAPSTPAPPSASSHP